MRARWHGVRRDLEATAAPFLWLLFTTMNAAGDRAEDGEEENGDADSSHNADDDWFIFHFYRNRKGGGEKTNDSFFILTRRVHARIVLIHSAAVLAIEMSRLLPTSDWGGDTSYARNFSDVKA